MLINKFIEKAEKKAGTQKELAKMLGITTSYIRNVKAGKSGLPVEVCIMIADYTGEDRLEVIAASNLVTEKDERKRKILESCFRKVASFADAAAITSILTITPQGVVNAQSLNAEFTKIQIIRNCRRHNYRRKSDWLSLWIDKLLNAFQHARSAA